MIIMEFQVPTLAEIVNFGIKLPNGTSYPWSPQNPVPVSVQLAVRRHYFAAITFMDRKVGQVLGALKELALDQNTVVIFHADHGYFQGESGEWEKKMLFENTARVPLIIHNPLSPVHRRSQELAELVDVYPTAAVLAGFLLPPGVDGVSLAALVGGDGGAGESTGASMIKAAAFTQYPRCHAANQNTGTCLEVGAKAAAHTLASLPPAPVHGVCAVDHGADKLDQRWPSLY